MLLSMNARGLPRYSATSIWSSETPWRWVWAAMRERVSPRFTVYWSASPPVATGGAGGR